jgi:hypothetical protein
VSAARYDTRLETGTDWRRTVLLRDEAGATVTPTDADAALALDTGEVIDMTCTIQGDGSVRIDLSSAQTAMLKECRAEWDLYVTAAGLRHRVLAGMITIIDGVADA